MTIPSDPVNEHVDLQARSVSVVRAGRTLVDHVSLHVSSGELVGLIGPNGAGKSTLLSVLAGVEEDYRGDVLLNEFPLRSLAPAQRARTMSWVEQLGAVHWPITVERLVMLGRIPHLPAWASPGETDRNAVDAALVMCDCEHLRLRKVNTLSGGERSRALLARALAAEPAMLFADEPIATLDLGHQLQTMELLKFVAHHGKAALVVMHDLSLAARFCDRLFLMHEGRLVASGTVAEVLSPANLADVYGVSVISGCEGVPWIIPHERLR